MLFSTRLQENPSLEESEDEGAPPPPPMLPPVVPQSRSEPWKKCAHGIAKFPSDGFEFEAARILRTNKDSPLNLLLLSPPGGEEATDKYVNAVRSHLVRDSQAQKDGLLAAYFKVTQALQENRTALARDFVQAVIRFAR
jgi:hypothetical protein